MLSKISLGLNLVIIIALFFLFNNGENEDQTVEKKQVSNTGMRIAYLNTDSLDRHYEFANDLVNSLEEEAEKKQRRLERKAQKAQQEFNNLQQSARSMTPSQLQVAQQRAVEMEQEIQRMQNDLANEFAIEQNEMQMKLINKLDSFLIRYNDTANYDFIIKQHIGSQILIASEKHDITEEVLNLLNAEYKAEKDASKE